MSMAAILFNGVDQTNCQYPFNRRPHVKIAQAVLEKKTSENYTILYMYIVQGQGQIILRGQSFDCN